MDYPDGRFQSAMISLKTMAIDRIWLRLPQDIIGTVAIDCSDVDPVWMTEDLTKSPGVFQLPHLPVVNATIDSDSVPNPHVQLCGVLAEEGVRYVYQAASRYSRGCVSSMTRKMCLAAKTPARQC